MPHMAISHLVSVAYNERGPRASTRANEFAHVQFSETGLTACRMESANGG
jgi:hypothetical protein